MSTATFPDPPAAARAAPPSPPARRISDEFEQLYRLARDEMVDDLRASADAQMAGSLLYIASLDGDAVAVQTILAAHPRALEPMGGDASSCLHAAATSGDADTIRIIAAAAPHLCLFCDVENGETPLHVLVGAGSNAPSRAEPDALRALLDAPGGVNACAIPNLVGRTALHTAVMWSKPPWMCGALARADPSTVSQVGALGLNPIEVSIMANTAAIAFQLVAAAPAACVVRTNGVTPMDLAASSGRWTIVREMLRLAMPLADAQDILMSLSLACVNGTTLASALEVAAKEHPDMLRTVLLAHSKWSGWTLLHYAALSNSPGNIQAIMETARALGIPGGLARAHMNPLPPLKTERNSLPINMCCSPVCRELLALDMISSGQVTSSCWALVPNPCPELVHMLPMLQQRGDTDARYAAQRLPPDTLARLHAALFSLSLSRASRGLPPNLVAKIAAMAM